MSTLNNGVEVEEALLLSAELTLTARDLSPPSTVSAVPTVPPVPLLPAPSEATDCWLLRLNESPRLMSPLDDSWKLRTGQTSSD